MDSVTDCINQLAQTDDEWGRLKGKLKATEYRMKKAKARSYMSCTGTGGEREAQSRLGDEYGKLLQEFEDDSMDFHIIDARRTRWELTISVYQTQVKARQQGNV